MDTTIRGHHPIPERTTQQNQTQQSITQQRYQQQHQPKKKRPKRSQQKKKNAPGTTTENQKRPRSTRIALPALRGLEPRLPARGPRRVPGEAAGGSLGRGHRTAGPQGASGERKEDKLGCLNPVTGIFLKLNTQHMFFSF